MIELIVITLKYLQLAKLLYVFQSFAIYVTFVALESSESSLHRAQLKALGSSG